MPLTATEVVQGQLDAYNNRDIDSFMSFWTEDALYFEHPDRLLANGAREIRERHLERFKDEALFGKLVSRVLLGDKVVDTEIVRRSFADGPGFIDVVATYLVAADKIKAAWFIFGPVRQG